jgi:3',5'-cyclic AMP phosphodiesterase CpdA
VRGVIVLVPPLRAVVLGLLLLALVLAGCGDDPLPPRADPAPGGSTLEGTWVDLDGDGRLERGPGEPLRDRTALGRRERPGRELARFGLVTDAHVRDEESPARVPFLDRLGPPFESTFRPQEALAPHVLAGALRALGPLRPQALLVAGDLVDNAQANELDQALTVLDGGIVRPDSGSPGYHGIQAATNPDPFYYRPDVDPPTHPGLLDDAQRPFRSPGAPARWLPALGNHDWLVAGEVLPSATIEASATGGRAVAEVDPAEALEGIDGVATRRPDPGDIDRLLRAGLPGRDVRVPADPGRRLLSRSEVVRRLAAAGGVRPEAGRLDHVADVGRSLRLVVLDTEAASARGAVDGLAEGRHRGSRRRSLTDEQVGWLDAQLRRAGKRWVVVVSHRPLDRPALEHLGRFPRVVAALAGDTHDHAIRPVRTLRGPGLWQVTTASLADFPQQARAFALRETPSGGVALETWTVDHAGGRLATISRELAHLDAQGGRPAGSAGRPGDRNARLFRAAP